jgi:hypothetical protein
MVQVRVSHLIGTKESTLSLTPQWMFVKSRGRASIENDGQKRLAYTRRFQSDMHIRKNNMHKRCGRC